MSHKISSAAKTKFSEAEIEARRKQERARYVNAVEICNSLPDDANVRIRSVAGLLGGSTATARRLVAKGLLPQPKKIGTRITVWNLGEVRRAIAVMAA